MMADPPWWAKSAPPGTLPLGRQKSLAAPDVTRETSFDYENDLQFHTGELGDGGFDTASSAVRTWDVETFSQPAYPEPVYDRASVDHLLTDRMRQVLSGLLPILKRQARLNFALTTAVSVWGLANQEDQSNRVVVTQWVQLPSKHALRYWDRLAVAIHAWSKTIPDPLATIVLERIVVEIRWKRRDGIV
jgi:hypothetical protein